MRTLISLLLLLPLATACASGPSKSELDAEVKRLCAIDGGIKVYETVTLPPEKFDKYGNVSIPSKEHAKIEDEYYIEWKIIYLKDGDPSLLRSHHRLIRRSNQKLLGESIMYSRGGGDLPGPWHPSSFSCPEPSQHPSLESSIFVKGDKK